MFLAVTCSLHVFSQDFSNRGKEFYLAYCYHASMVNGGNSADRPVIMTVNMTSDVSSTYEIYTGRVLAYTGTISPGQVVSRVISQSYFIDGDGQFDDRAIYIKFSAPSVVYSYITQQNASGATVVLPINVLGKEYISSSFTQRSNNKDANSYITIIAIEDNTNIEVTPSAPTVGGWAAGSVNQITLNKGQIYQVLGVNTDQGGNSSFSSGVDLSGTRIKTISVGSAGCKKVAVFSGSGRLYISDRTSGTNASVSSDNLYQQLYPVATWGKKYISVPSISRRFNFYRIYKSGNAGTVTVNGIAIPNASFNTNNYYEFTSSEVNVIESTEPVMVAQYFTSQNAYGNGAPYDPDMVILNPVEQNLSKVTLVSSELLSSNDQHYIHAVVKNGGSSLSSFRFDGNVVPVGNFTTVPSDPAYSYVYINAGTVQGNHTLACDSGFNAIAYGYATTESYAYSAGANVRDLYQYLSTVNAFAAPTETDVAACIGSPFKFKITLPYQPSYLKWDFKGLYPNIEITNPMPTSTIVVNGRTLYQYGLAPDYQVDVVGTYPVSVVTDNPTPDGCSGLQEIDFELKIYANPTANFVYKNNGCFNDIVTFKDSSITEKPAYKWFWTFHDGTTASTKDTTKLFNAPGIYKVKLKILTTVGCFSPEVEKDIKLTSIPQPDFNVSGLRCPGSTLTLTDNSTNAFGNIVEWKWGFPDGTAAITKTDNSAITKTFAVAGTYKVTLTTKTETGCTNVFSNDIVINEKPKASFTLPSAVCLPLGIANFVNNSSIVGNTINSMSYSWNFGDNAATTPKNIELSPTYNYASAGPFTVSLTATSALGCVDDSVQTLSNVFAAPLAGIQPPQEICAGGSITLRASNNAGAGSTVAEHYWDLGTGSFVLASPANASTQLATFANSGPVTIRHYFKTDKGCVSDIATTTLQVNAKPIALLNVGALKCEGTSVSFTDGSTTPSGTTITKYIIDYGDGTEVQTLTSFNNVTHTYATATTFNVTYTIENSKGCASTPIIVPVLVNRKPKADFTMPKACIVNGSTNVTFTNTSSIADGTTNLLTYNWNFGDAASGANNTSTAINGVHTYTTATNYNIKLVATSSNNCIAEETKVFNTIYPQPVANFTAVSEVCFKDEVSFTDASTPLIGTITKWEWNFGDGSPIDNNQSPKHTYALAGPYTVSLTITTSNGCVSNAFTKPITVLTIPTPNYTITNPTCVTRAIGFDDITTLTNAGNITQYIWSLGDGTASQTRTNSNSFDYTYVETGNYITSLAVVTDKGCKSVVVTKNITVNPLPVVIPKLPEICLLDPTAPFDDLSTIADGTAASFTYAWTFGDPNANAANPNTAFIKNPTHKYINTGKYDVSLTVTSNNGCAVRKDTFFFVNGTVPQGALQILNDQNLCSNKKVEVKNNSTVDVGNITRLIIQWDYTNNPTIETIDEDPVPGKIYTHEYPEFGTPATRNVTVRIKAYSGGVCESINDQPITLKASPMVSFNAIPYVCLEQDDVQITQGIENTGIAGSGIYFGVPAISNTGIFSPAISGVGKFELTYVFNANNGCTDTAKQFIDVYPSPEIDLGPDVTVLQGGTKQLKPVNVSNNVNGYLWTPATYLSADNIANPFTTPSEDITYTLRVVSTDGCTSKDDIFVKVLLKPEIPNTFTPNGDGVNDRWDIKYLDTYPGATIEVFNRYGQSIFRTQNYTAWDGKARGVDVPVGTYYYVIDPKNGRKAQAGYVTVIR